MRLTASMCGLMRWLFAVALCLVSSSSQIAGLSLHAAHLTPALSLLTWSSPSPLSVLSLSLASSPLVSFRRVSLSASSASHLVIRSSDSAPASAHFTLCERHDSDQRQRRDPTSAAAPHCAYATLPAALPSSVLTPRPDGQRRWDLCGARLAAEVTRSPDEPTARRFRWSVATVTDDLAAPPLLYSLFAEWTAHTITEDELKTAVGKGLAADTTDADLTPQLQTHSIRICSAQSRGPQGAQQMHCDVPADRLPRGVELTLHLLTECDYQRIDEEAAEGAMPHCVSAISPAVVVTLESLLAEGPPLAAASPLSFTAADGVAHVTNDPVVREALCTFYNQTSGPLWNDWMSHGWCDPTVPICGNATVPGWSGIGCDSQGQVILTLELSAFGLVSASPSGVDVSALCTVLDGLQVFDLSLNSGLLLSRLDVTPLANLRQLWLGGLAATSSQFQPLLLPSPLCQLGSIDLTATSFAASGWSACTQLTRIDITSNKAPFPFTAITTMPMLQFFAAPRSGLTCQGVDREQSGGELTLFILAQLNVTNPQLQNLDVSYSNLPFGSANSTDNFPRVVAPSLTSLKLDGLPLRTGPMGPADSRWLSGMPSLRWLSMLELAEVTVDTSAFNFASRALEALSLSSPALGDLSPLYPMASLAVLALSGSGLRSQLPSNVSSYWPQLTTITCNSCNLVGNLPNFTGLPFLQEVDTRAVALRKWVPVRIAHAARFYWLCVLRLISLRVISQARLERDSRKIRRFCGWFRCLRSEGTHALSSAQLAVSRGSVLRAYVGCAVCARCSRLESPLPSFCGSPAIELAYFESNLITALPNLTCYTSVSELSLQSNPILGQLPVDFWNLLTATGGSNLLSLDISHTQLNGSIPDRDPSLPQMGDFSAANCRFSGRLPLNINARTIDLSGNDIEGPLGLFDSTFFGTPKVQSLRLSSLPRLTCPIDIGRLLDLQSLDISHGGFDCDWADMTLPARLSQIDISWNEWRPFDLTILPQLVSLRADHAGVTGILGPSDPTVTLSLQELSLDGSSFTQLNSAGWTVEQQLRFLLSCQLGQAPLLKSFRCRECGIALSLSVLMGMVSPQPPVYQCQTSSLAELRLDGNGLFGELPNLSLLFFMPVAAFPPWLAAFTLSRNPHIRGRLPPVTTIFVELVQSMSLFIAPQMSSIDLGSTAISGPLPPSWASLSSLTQLNLTDCDIQCDLIIDEQSRMQCADQSVVTASSTIAIESPSLADPAAGVHCSALTIVATGSSGVTVDPSYHSHTECRCDANSFGLNALCYRCPEGCTCSDDRIANCFPVVQRGSIGVNAALGASTARSVVAGSIAPFTVTALLPCPRTVTGSSLCNPDGIAWPSFYRIVEQAGSASVSAALTVSGASSSSDSDLDLSSWCYPGHTGRLCAACSNGYFSSGHWCLRCLSEGVHVLILSANLLLIVALIAYLYGKSPSAVTAAKGLQLYLTRVSQSAVRRSHSMSLAELNRLAADPLSLSSNDADNTTDPATSGPVNPLKLLIFHSQQLSLLLHTSTSLPPVMAGLLGALNSGSTGFALSSLVAIECLSSWTLRDRCWMAVFAPALIGLVAGLTALFGHKSRSEASGRTIQLQGRDEPLLAAGAEADVPRSSSTASRIYSVCVSLLYFLFFPCAQIVLAAVACTDTRESDRSYLNLYPAQACDDEWRRTILPPAVLGLLFWVIAFPLGSTVMLLRLRRRVASSAVSESTAACALSVWPVCSDLLLPYSPRFWFWDQLLLLRRLLLVAAVTIIPASSLYLPLVLFAIIQLSALQQHWARPYVHASMNSGELASLYLLLINYISAIILQTGLTEGGFQATANTWVVLLFLVNALFLLLLVAGLFGWARQWIATKLRSRSEKLDMAPVIVSR